MVSPFSLSQRTALELEMDYHLLLINVIMVDKIKNNIVTNILKLNWRFLIMPKFCKNCYENTDRTGFLPFFNVDTQICPNCHSEGLIDSALTGKEINILGDATNNNKVFLKAMDDLKRNDIIEFESRMMQFKKQKEDNIPKCPTCGSSNIEKISLGKKAVRGALFGLFSSDVRKTMHCKNCGAKW